MFLFSQVTFSTTLSLYPSISVFIFQGQKLKYLYQHYHYIAIFVQ